MTAIILLLSTILLSMLVTRIAGVALTFTGLSRDMARFQARSAFTTVGFTTTESEGVVNHPVRRRIIMLLMLGGNAGFVGVVASSLATFEGFEGAGEYGLISKLGVMVAGLAGLWAVGMSQWIDDRLFVIISWALRRWTQLDVHDFRSLLQLGEGYNVTEIELEPEDWLVGQRLDQLRLSNVGVNVLSIHRAAGEFVGTPVGGTYVRRGDKLIVYGAREAILRLNESKGDPEEAERHKRTLIEIQAQREKKGGGRNEGYCVMEIAMREGDWPVGKQLIELRLGDLGVNVLGIERDNEEYVGAPVGTTGVCAGDRLVVYGRRDDLVAIEEGRSDSEEAERQHKRMNGKTDKRRRDDPQGTGEGS